MKYTCKFNHYFDTPAVSEWREDGRDVEQECCPFCGCFEIDEVLCRACNNATPLDGLEDCEECVSEKAEKAAEWASNILKRTG